MSLSLLDLYFEELIEPVSEAARKGHTRVDPDAYQNASATELDSYFSGIRADLQSVKDDIRDLKDALLASLQDIQSTTTKTATLAEGIDSKAARIETRARVLNRRLLVLGGIAAVGLVVAAVTLHLVTGNKETSQQILKKVGDSSQSVTQIVGQLRLINSTGGLVTNPKSPADYYHNARLLAQRGETDRAIQSVRTPVLL